MFSLLVDVVKGKNYSKDGGFTAFELLAVIATIGVMAALAIPLYLHQLGVASDEDTEELGILVAETVSAEITEDMNGDTPVSVSLSPGGKFIVDVGDERTLVDSSQGNYDIVVNGSSVSPFDSSPGTVGSYGIWLSNDRSDSYSGDTESEWFFAGSRG